MKSGRSLEELNPCSQSFLIALVPLQEIITQICTIWIQIFCIYILIYSNFALESWKNKIFSLFPFLYRNAGFGPADLSVLTGQSHARAHAQDRGNGSRYVSPPRLWGRGVSPKKSLWFVDVNSLQEEREREENMRKERMLSRTCNYDAHFLLCWTL